MKEKITFTLLVNKNKCQIENGNARNSLAYLFANASETEFEINLVDENGFSSRKDSLVVAYFVKECLKDPSKRCFAIPLGNGSPYEIADVTISFINNLLQSDKDERTYKSFEEFHKMDVLNNKTYFTFYLPVSLLSKEKYDEYLVMGPDYLMGSFLFPKDIFTYILPVFYKHLYDIDGFDNQEVNNLASYQIGLA